MSGPANHIGFLEDKGIRRVRSGERVQAKTQLKLLKLAAGLKGTRQ
jgi:hypothetical protein